MVEHKEAGSEHKSEPVSRAINDIEGAERRMEKELESARLRAADQIRSASEKAARAALDASERSKSDRAARLASLVSEMESVRAKMLKDATARAHAMRRATISASARSRIVHEILKKALE